MRNTFKEWYEGFKQSELYSTMCETKEDSPYHREANVGVHTDMVVSEYLRLSPDVWSSNDLIGALACAFHDTGKPMAEEVLTRTDGSTYRRYSGHDMNSANIFIDYFARFSHENVFMTLTANDIYQIWVMVAYHMPYRLGHDRVKTLITHLRESSLVDIFYRVLRADANGRTSDDHVKTVSSCEKWISESSIYESSDVAAVGTKEIILLCGVSGVGKSMVTKTICAQNSDVGVHSMDELRHRLYDMDNYANAFKLSCEDKEFGNKVTRDYNDVCRKHDTIVVDNTHLSHKRRKQYVKRQGAYKTKAIVVLSSLNRVIENQKTRGDKQVPEHVVKQMFYNFVPPLIGEVNTVEVIIYDDYNVRL